MEAVGSEGDRRRRGGIGRRRRGDRREGRGGGGLWRSGSNDANMLEANDPSRCARRVTWNPLRSVMSVCACAVILPGLHSGV